MTIIDPYGPTGIAFAAGVQARLDGRPQDCATSEAMILGWVKADEAVCPPVAPVLCPPVASTQRFNTKPIVAAGLGVLIVGAAAAFIALTATPARAPLALDLPPPTAAPVKWEGYEIDLPPPPAAPSVKFEGYIALPGQPVDQVLTQLRAKNPSAHKPLHHFATTETSNDLLRQGDAYLETGNAAAAKALYGQVAGGNDAAAIVAADRLNQLDLGTWP